VYIDTAKKRYKMTCRDLGARLELINNLLLKFPGAGGNPPYTAQDIKLKFYNMMIDEWKNKFMSAGLNLMDH